MKYFKYILVFTFLFLSGTYFAQISAGKIVYERKTNLHKKFKGESKDWIQAEDKTKTDFFELYFNDTLSVFKPQETELKEKFSWATSKNSAYQYFNTNKLMWIKDIWGEKIFVNDSIKKRTWKITESTRNIAGYKCRKAIWQVNDSTRMYAWYADAIICSTGPESFNGLPGAILGLATEDGGVIYFAKSVEAVKPAAEVLYLKTEKKKIYAKAELRKKIETEYGKYPWGKMLIRELFDIW